MAVYKDGDKWRVLYRYTIGPGNGSRHRKEVLRQNGKRNSGNRKKY